jgi:hypothetical protein
LGFNLIEKDSRNIKNPIIAGYKPTKFFMLYVIRKIMQDDPVGNKFFSSPKDFFTAFRKKYKEAFHKLIQILIIEFNSYIDQNTRDTDGYIDYKNLLRNETNIKQMADSIISAYKRLLVHHKEDELKSLLK